MSIFQAIFSANFLSSVVRMATPIIFVAMAACIGRQADIMCIAYEGMMLFAALGGALGSAFTHSLGLGALIGIISGMFIALIFAYFVLYLDTSAMLIGIALNTLGSCGTIYLLYLFTGRKSDSTTLTSFSFPNVKLDFLKDVPVIGPIFAEQNLLTYFGIIMVVVVFILIYKTPLGLRIRSVGEDPSAAVSLGINVRKTKFIALMISGFLASVGGLFMSMAYIPYFTKNMVSGRGFIGIAASNLAAGNPIVAFICSLVFGAADALSNVAQAFRFPAQFASMIPYVVTIIGLCFTGTSGKVRAKKVKKAKNLEV